MEESLVPIELNETLMTRLRRSRLNIQISLLHVSGEHLIMIKDT